MIVRRCCGQAMPGAAAAPAPAPACLPSWPDASFQAAPVETLLPQPPAQPQELAKPFYGGVQPAMYACGSAQPLLPVSAIQPAVPAAPPRTIAAAAPAPQTIRTHSTSSSGSQRGDSRGSGGARMQLPQSAQPDTPQHPSHLKGRVKQTHRTAQKRYRERQKASAHRCG